MSNVPATQQGGQVAERTPAQELVAIVRGDVFRRQVEMALPEGVPAQRFVRATVTALLQNPDLATADRDSLIASLIKSAQDGLMPDGREAALVTFKSKVKSPQGDTWVTKAQYLPMIGGFRKIAAEHGWTLQTAVVFEGDAFDYQLGLDARLEHKPVKLGEQRGKPIGAYAVARHRDGRSEFEVLTAEEIEKVRQVSRAKDSGPWRDWWERMWEKTAGRRLFAKLPLDPADRRVARLVELPDEPGEAADALYGPGAGDTFRARELAPAATPAAQPVDGGADSEGAAGQQAASGGSAPAAAAAAPETSAAADDGASSAGSGAQAAQPGAAAEADPDPEPAPAGGQQAAFPLPDAVVAEALATEVTFGKWQGMTLAEVVENEAGVEYIGWCLEHLGQVPEQLHAPLLVVARAYGLLEESD